jgi:hypothetical protein
VIWWRTIFSTLLQFLGRDGLVVREVEAHAIGRDERALLVDVRRPAPRAGAKLSRCVAVWLLAIASRRACRLDLNRVADAISPRAMWPMCRTYPPKARRVLDDELAAVVVARVQRPR